MAKKKSNEVTAKVTNLPLPVSDTPLVIDLPDGQKIVIGKMQSGSVIEVATWRGTGRPDSRTNRLMMGVNSANPAVTNQTPEANNSESPNQSNAGDWKSKGANALEIAKKATVTFISQSRKKASMIKVNLPKAKTPSTSKPAETEPSTEIDEWLKKVLERSEKNRSQSKAKPLSKNKKQGTKAISNGSKSSTKSNRSKQIKPSKKRKK